MKKDDVLVSAELAKEKLARVVYVNAYRGYIDWDLIEAIRNTDLTDCQQQETQRLVWLIEKDTPAKWLRGGWLECMADESWTTNAHEAVPFLSKKDAEEYVAYWYRNVLERDWPSVTEHAFIAPAPDQQQGKAMNEHSSGTRAEVPPSATDSGTWISVDERLPEIDDIVIGFWNPSAGVIPSCYGITKYAGYWCNPDDSDVAYGVPSHWMPLPNPPANWKKRPLLQEMDTGTDSARSGDQIKPDGADQGSVRNATDEQEALRERCANAVPTTWLDPLLTGPKARHWLPANQWRCA